MTAIDPIRVLRDAVIEAGSQKNWAKANGLSPAYVNDLLQGRREPTSAILEALGLEKIVYYRRLDAETADDRHRREVEILTAHTYYDLRAKLSSMSSDEAAAELSVSVDLIKEWRGRLGVVDWRPRP